MDDVYACVNLCNLDDKVELVMSEVGDEDIWKSDIILYKNIAKTVRFIFLIDIKFPLWMLEMPYSAYTLMRN